MLPIHKLLQEHTENFRKASSSLFQLACYGCYMRKLFFVNETTSTVTLTYLLYKIEDTTLLLVLKVIFKSRAAKNASIISEFVRLSILILLYDSACTLYNFTKDSTWSWRTLKRTVCSPSINIPTLKCVSSAAVLIWLKPQESQTLRSD